jgi:hypothetical protein
MEHGLSVVLARADWGRRLSLQGIDVRDLQEIRGVVRAVLEEKGAA